MSEELRRSIRRRNKGIDIKQEVKNDWLFYTGTCEIFTTYLLNQSNHSVWIIVKFIDSILRSFGQVIFANNPLSGVLILIGLTVADPNAGMAALLLSIFGTVFSVIFNQEPAAVQSGQFGYNQVLIGSVTVGMLPHTYEEINPTEPKFWLILILASFFLTILTSSMAQCLKVFNLPNLSMPFNIAQLLILFVMLNNFVPKTILTDYFLNPINSSFHEPQSYLRNNQSNFQIENTTQDVKTRWLLEVRNGTGESEDLIWSQVLEGTVVSASQVYGLKSVPGAVLIYIGLFVFSPILAGFSYLGAVLGTLLGTILTNDNEEIYNGVWGYNGLLCSSAIGGMFFVLNGYSAILAVSSVLLVCAVQHFMSFYFRMLNLPIWSFPFNIVTWMFLCATSARSNVLIRPDTYSCPEKQREEWMEEGGHTESRTRVRTEE